MRTTTDAGYPNVRGLIVCNRVDAMSLLEDISRPLTYTSKHDSFVLKIIQVLMVSKRLWEHPQG